MRIRNINASIQAPTSMQTLQHRPKIDLAIHLVMQQQNLHGRQQILLMSRGRDGGGGGDFFKAPFVVVLFFFFFFSLFLFLSSSLDDKSSEDEYSSSDSSSPRCACLMRFITGWAAIGVRLFVIFFLSLFFSGRNAARGTTVLLFLLLLLFLSLSFVSIVFNQWEVDSKCRETPTRGRRYEADRYSIRTVYWENRGPTFTYWTFTRGEEDTTEK